MLRRVPGRGSADVDSTVSNRARLCKAGARLITALTPRMGQLPKLPPGLGEKSTLEKLPAGSAARQEQASEQGRKARNREPAPKGIVQVV